AAYDFLLLRLTASSEHAEDVAFWREAQTQSGEELSAALGVAAPRDAYAEDDAAPPKRRRRRRRSGSAAAPATE
ncbi:MAG: polynucleotide adenylyltransferase PcnB, partial [Pseudoxanthomonas sp.]